MYIWLFCAFQAGLSEGDSAAVPHLWLQTPCRHSSAAFHQPGSHQGTVFIVFVVTCCVDQCHPLIVNLLVFLQIRIVIRTFSIGHLNDNKLNVSQNVSINNKLSHRVSPFVYFCPWFMFLVSSEIIAGRDIRFSALLSGSGVRLFFKAFHTWAHQLPGWNFTSVRAGQDVSWYEPMTPQVYSANFAAIICKVQSSWWTCPCSRVHLGAAFQAVREVQWTSRVVRLWILQELEQKSPSAVRHTKLGAEKRPWERSLQVRNTKWCFR